MEESVFSSSSEVSTTADHTYSREDGYDTSVQATEHPSARNGLHNDETVKKVMNSEQNVHQADPQDIEPVETAVLQLDSAAAKASAAAEDTPTAADDVTGTSDGCQNSDIVEPAVNGNVSKSDEEKNVDASSTVADDGLKLAVNRAKQKFVAFQRLDHPASVVIDLRSPPLVQVCLLHGTDDLGASGSGSSGTATFPRRQQIARRGRRRDFGTISHRTNVISSSDERAFLGHHAGTKDVLHVLSNQFAADSDEESHNRDENASAELSTVIHLKVVDTPGEKVASGQSPETDNAVYDPQHRLRRSNGDQDSESSDDNTMKVRNVNRTYSRTPSVMAARKNPHLITVAKSTDVRKHSEVSFDSGAKITSFSAQEFKSVPKKFKKAAKRRMRIGPAWFSRSFLDAPPPELYECVRTLTSVKVLKCPNYNEGVRHFPIATRPSTVKRELLVPVVEEADIATVGREQLKLWRLGEEDISELQSQLRQEAEHRRSEHIMPLVMQMTDAQIEDAYERIAESMKTYEIVEADSDEELPEDEENEEAVADSYENSHQLETSEWSIYEEIAERGSGETEYSRLRPKRHAVDYGPAAFTPILMMEGRRLFSRRRRSSKSADIEDGAKLQRCSSHGNRSHRRRSTKSKFTERLDKVMIETPLEKSTNATEDSPGFSCNYYIKNC